MNVNDLEDLIKQGKQLVAAERETTEAAERRKAEYLAALHEEAVKGVCGFAPALKDFAKYDAELHGYSGYVTHRVRVEVPECAPLFISADIEADYSEGVVILGTTNVLALAVDVVQLQIEEGDPFSDDDPFVLGWRLENVGATKIQDKFRELLARALVRAIDIGDVSKVLEGERQNRNAVFLAAAKKEKQVVKIYEERFNRWNDWLSQIKGNDLPLQLGAVLGLVLVDIAWSLSDIRDEIEKRGL